MDSAPVEPVPMESMPVEMAPMDPAPVEMTRFKEARITAPRLDAVPLRAVAKRDAPEIDQTGETDQSCETGAVSFFRSIRSRRLGAASKARPQTRPPGQSSPQILSAHDMATGEVFTLIARHPSPLEAERPGAPVQYVPLDPRRAGPVYEIERDDPKPQPELGALEGASLGHGTQVTTEEGDMAVEDLVEGMRVVTRDHGLQQIQWLRSCHADVQGADAPIFIRKGALGNEADFIVAPAQRILLSGWEAEMLFGQTEVLARADALLAAEGVARMRQAAQGTISVVQLLFDAHEVIYANGIAVESLEMNAQMWAHLPQTAQMEISARITRFADGPGRGHQPARPVLQEFETHAYLAAVCSV